ncbi:MAG TPA: hypothetical protein VLQ48_10605 [Chloroflexia bacterium]|nr:hypothetical protein [Chloroflexia bacterium]
MQDPLRIFFSIACALFLLVLIIGVVFALFAYARGTYRHAAHLLDQWASDNQYRIIESDRRYLRKGPFTWISSQNQIIYRVTVQGPSGNIRHGWVRCGSYLLGAWQNTVDVRWEDQPADLTTA